VTPTLGLLATRHDLTDIGSDVTSCISELFSYHFIHCLPEGESIDAYPYVKPLSARPQFRVIAWTVPTFGPVRRAKSGTDQRSTRNWRGGQQALDGRG